jgi:hypothetical protein
MMMTPYERAQELINERIDSWHQSDSDVDLHEWLGWSKAEYNVWVESSEPPPRVLALFECVDDVISERKIREADVSDGSKVKWGHNRHISDLKRRIGELTTWRDKHPRGSETRAMYSRLVQKLKQELGSAQRAAENKKKSR